jgi:hypothetical protein
MCVNFSRNGFTKSTPGQAPPEARQRQQTCDLVQQPALRSQSCREPGAAPLQRHGAKHCGLSSHSAVDPAAPDWAFGFALHPNDPETSASVFVSLNDRQRFLSF